MPRWVSCRTSAFTSATAMGSTPAKGSSSSMKIGVGGQRAGDLDAAAFAARQRQGIGIGEVRDAEFVEQLRRAALALALRERDSALSSTARMLPFDAQAAEDRGLLRQVADAEPPALEQRQARDGVAVEPDLALVGLEQAHDHGEDRGLAGAVGSEAGPTASPRRTATDTSRTTVVLAEALGEAVGHEPAGLVDARSPGRLAHCGVNTPVTRPLPPPVKVGGVGR